MSRLHMPLPLFFAAAFAAVPPSPLLGQETQLRPVTVGSPMADFTLPVYQGGELTISDLQGKKVMLVFPRGLSSPTSWCHVCPYQHAELADLDATDDVRAKSNLEILFVLPYDRDKVGEWIAAFPTLLQDIEDWKNPPDPATLDDAGRARLERVQRAFPRTFHVEPQDVVNSFPILMDADRTVSSGLGFFTNDWGGSDADQNIPTILIVDENGILQFKYMSQNTMDRPPPEYLIRIIEGLRGMGS